MTLAYIFLTVVGAGTYFAKYCPARRCALKQE